MYLCGANKMQHTQTFHTHKIQIMQVLIAKQNQEIVQGLTKTKLQFQENTKNTCTFRIGPKGFQKLCDAARAAGFNIYGLFAW